MRKALVALLAAGVAYGCSDKQPTTPSSASCAFSVSAPTTSFGSNGGTGTANVTTGSACTWSASSQADWLRVGGETHTGTGSVSFTVAASDASAPRTAALTIASQSISISQEAAGGPLPPGCSFALSAEPDDYERDGGNGQLRIAAAAGCAWAIKQDGSWLTVEGPAQGTGPATLKVFATPNEDAPGRQATITIANASVRVTQPGQGDCSFQVSPAGSFGLPSAPFSDDIAIATSRGCRWTAASDAPWLHLDTAGGSGSGKVTYQTDSNPGSPSANTRPGTIAIRWAAPTAGQNVHINQWGPCTAFAPNTVNAPLPVGASFSGALATGGTLTVGADGGEFRFFVLAEPFMSCVWMADSADPGFVQWVFPPLRSPRTGDGDLHFTVPANPSTNGRTAVVTVGDRPLTIIQRGR
jgi:hypothetical protein